ncbi:putative Gnk2-like domain-containing protein [Helianthus anomalus]
MEMKSIISFLFILQAIINGANLSIAQDLMEDRHECRGYFKSINVQKNRDSAFDKLIAQLKDSNSSYNGFHHTQVGDKPEEQVSAIYLCPPNAQSKPICECCLRHVVEYAIKKCPKQNEVVAWDLYESVQCMVRYSVGRKIFSVLDDWAWYCHEGDGYVKTDELEKTVDGLVSKLKEHAAEGDALRKFASESVTYDRDEFPLHVAVQCTPDISKEDCTKCLSKAINGIRSCSTSKRYFAGSYLSANCYVWYSHIDGLLDPPTEFNEYCNPLFY